jgi:hypothetical protein
LIVESIDIYHREQEKHVIEENPEEGWIHVITTHHGVDDSTYSLDSIFKEYFPNLQRRSALITLVSFFEHQLAELCSRFAEDRKFALKATDLRGDGIGRLSLYLAKVAGLPLDNGREAWDEIRHIQSVRNAIVHNDGKLRDTEKALIEYGRSNGILSEELWVKINAEYLPHVIETFDSYFKEISKLITRTDRA